MINSQIIAIQKYNKASITFDLVYEYNIDHVKFFDQQCNYTSIIDWLK